MLKRKILILIPLLLILYILVDTWLQAMGVIGEQFAPAVRHYLALILFVPLVWYFWKDIKRCIVYTGIYLVLTTFQLIAITPYTVTSNWVGIASLKIPLPPTNGWMLLILLLYSILHFDVLTNYYLDYKEEKEKKKTQQ
jgi:hypothetical protein